MFVDNDFSYIYNVKTEVIFVNQNKTESFNSYFNGFSFSESLNIVFNQVTGSTNQDAKELAQQGCKNALVIALEQTNGKGRLNRNFFSPKETGLYMSLLLHPKNDVEDVTYLTTLAAVSVAKAIEKQIGEPAYIKWVNDIYLNNKKVCGILCNSAFSSSGNLSYAIIGIGINLNTPKNGFPDDIKNIATSVFGHNEVTPTLRTELVECIVNEILNGLNSGLKTHIEEYRKRSYLNGKTVTFTKEGKNITATVTGIDDDCSLLLETAQGEKISLFAGEVSVKV